jgi:hypothetical protein
MTIAIEAPTDAQLGYIASLCREHGLQQPVVYSKQEASEIIGAMRGGTYDPDRYRLDADLPEALRR